MRPDSLQSQNTYFQRLRGKKRKIEKNLAIYNLVL